MNLKHELSTKNERLFDISEQISSFYTVKSLFLCLLCLLDLFTYFRNVIFEPKGIITTEIVIFHSPCFEKSQLCIKLQSCSINTLGFEYNFIDIFFNSFVEFIKQFLSNFQSSVLFQYNQHCNIRLFGIRCVIITNHTPDDLILIISHDCQLWPVRQKVIVRVNRVWLCELLSKDVNNPVKLFLCRETLQADFLFYIDLHWDFYYFLYKSKFIFLETNKLKFIWYFVDLLLF